MSKKLKTTQGICVHKLTYYFPDKDVRLAKEIRERISKWFKKERI